MIRTTVLGIGSYVPERVVTNDQVRFLNDKHEVCEEQQTETNDEWIQARTGIRERRYVPNDGSTACSDLGAEAAKAALADAGVEAKDVDCIIFATLSPDIHFPGTGVFLQNKLGINDGACPWDDIDWFVPHQANLRINQKLAEVAEIPEGKILNSIEIYGNTTAATVPLTIDHWRKLGKVKKGDRILSTVFGSGFTWGSAIFTV